MLGHRKLIILLFHPFQPIVILFQDWRMKTGLTIRMRPKRGKRSDLKLAYIAVDVSAQPQARRDRNATLHNADEIARLGIRVGDTVTVQPAREVIPQVLSVPTSKGPTKTIPYRFPWRCPCRLRTAVVRDITAAGIAGAISRCRGAFARPYQAVAHLKRFVSQCTFAMTVSDKNRSRFSSATAGWRSPRISSPRKRVMRGSATRLRRLRAGVSSQAVPSDPGASRDFTGMLHICARHPGCRRDNHTSPISWLCVVARFSGCLRRTDERKHECWTQDGCS